MSPEPEKPEGEDAAESRGDSGVEKKTLAEPWKRPVEGPPFGLAAGCGFGLLIIIVSGVLCASRNSLGFFYMGAFVALCTLIRRKTRMIFVGYVSIIAIILLAFIVICGNMRIN